MAERMLLRELLAAQDRRRVRNTKRTTVDGITFDSKREANRWAQLRALEAAGEIRNLRRQVPLTLMGQNGPLFTDKGNERRSRIDFAYEDKGLGWALVYEDAKGHETEVSSLKRAILAAMGIKVVLV